MNEEYKGKSNDHRPCVIVPDSIVKIPKVKADFHKYKKKNISSSKHAKSLDAMYELNLSNTKNTSRNTKFKNANHRK